MTDLVPFLNHYRQLLEEVQRYRESDLRKRLTTMAVELKTAQDQCWDAKIRIHRLEVENAELAFKVSTLEEAGSLSSDSGGSGSSSVSSDTIAVSDSSSETPLVFQSQEWWDHMLPEGLAGTTRGNYKFHLRQLKDDTPEGIEEWINSSTSTSYKQQRISLAKKIARISTHKIEVPLPDYEWFDVNHKPHAEYIQNYVRCEPKFFTEPLDIYTLFIYWLPTRRRDICSLQIVNKRPEVLEGNYFCRMDSTFIWSKYKTVARYGVQEFCIDHFIGWLPKEVTSKVVEFLRNLPEGPVYSGGEETVVRHIKQRTGLTLNESRHNWTTYIAKRFDQEIQRKLASWMAHHYVTGQVTYKN